jgi:hypothetical protein
MSKALNKINVQIIGINNEVNKDRLINNAMAEKMDTQKNKMEAIRMKLIETVEETRKICEEILLMKDELSITKRSNDVKDKDILNTMKTMKSEQFNIENNINQYIILLLIKTWGDLNTVIRRLDKTDEKIKEINLKVEHVGSKLSNQI